MYLYKPNCSAVTFPLVRISVVYLYTSIRIQHDKEARDPRGRTPLHLAVSLKRVRCAQELLNQSADVLAVNRHQYSGEETARSPCFCARAFVVIHKAAECVLRAAVSLCSFRVARKLICCRASFHIRFHIILS